MTIIIIITIISVWPYGERRRARLVTKVEYRYHICI